MEICTHYGVFIIIEGQQQLALHSLRGLGICLASALVGDHDLPWGKGC